MKLPGKTCPSSTMEPGASLLGVVNANGTVGYISTPVTVDAVFIAEMDGVADPESKFRFSGTCVEKGCKQWADGNCGVIKNVMAANSDVDLESQLPDCSIRSSCRWYHQEGAVACSFCPYIITDMLSKSKRTPV